MSVAEALSGRGAEPGPVQSHRLDTRAIDDPGRLIALLPREQALAWVKDDEGLIGWGELARLEVKGPDTFEQASRWWQEQLTEIVVSDEVSAPGTGPILFVSAAFDIRTGTSVFVVPRVVLGRAGSRSWLTAPAEDRPLLAVEEVPTPGAIRYADGAQTAAAWTSTVAEAITRLRAGDLDKVVLARDLMATTDEPLDPRHLLRHLADRWTECWTYELDGLVGATPELLLRRTGSHVTSRVLAGTAARAGQHGRDEEVGRALLASAKNQEEHRYAIASLAETLGPFCTSLDVPETPHLHALPTLMHLATDVQGELAGDPDLLSVIGAIHPTAAVCGTPRDVAIDLIAELEGMDRDRYAGPVGWLDTAGNGEFGVALRCAQIEERALRLFAGCGIVADSDPDDELVEAQVKLLAIRDALES